MSNELLISVIIPVYNTSKYLGMCLESVVNQSYKNLQIILVNDGSTDNSPQICDAWVEKDNRIQVIHKQNEGLGYTRNAGLDVAIGEFVSFLDSDDTLELNTYEDCVAEMNNNNADVTYFGRNTMNKKGKYLKNLINVYVKN